jgi:exosortase
MDTRDMRDPVGRAVSRGVATVPARLLIATAAVAVAYHQSLGALFSNWRYQTPLSELALVPPLAAGLLVVASLRHRHVGKIRLGRVDFAVAGALLALVLLPAVLAPVVYSNYVWPMRLDLLTLPLAASATCVLLFGTRSLLAFAFPLGFLFLAWPLPHSILVEQLIAGFTSWTGAAVTAIVNVVPLAEAIPASDSSRFALTHEGKEFVLSVGSACSGVNSLIGFLIVGTACLYLIRGKIGRRLLWLASGLVVVWSFNVLRILAIFAVGRLFGEAAAIDVIHPVAGLIALNAAFVVLLLLVPRYGLVLRGLADRAHSDTPLSEPAPVSEHPTNRLVLSRLGVLVPAALVLALANSQLTFSAKTFDNAGLPKLHEFAAHPVVGPQWRVQRARELPWARAYFGEDATWVRYRIDARRELASKQFTAWTDSIVTPDLGALHAFPARDCYDFHGFAVSLAQRVDIGGVVGQLLVFTDGKGLRWHGLTWQWPVRVEDWSIAHERVTLLASSLARPDQARPPPRATSPRDAVLSAFNLLDPDRDTNPSVSQALKNLAADMIAERLAHGEIA